jgi:hypothetical protein
VKTSQKAVAANVVAALLVAMTALLVVTSLAVTTAHLAVTSVTVTTAHLAVTQTAAHHAANGLQSAQLVAHSEMPTVVTHVDHSTATVIAPLAQAVARSRVTATTVAHAATSLAVTTAHLAVTLVTATTVAHVATTVSVQTAMATVQTA